MASDTADNIAWERYTKTTPQTKPNVNAALARITFSERSSSQPLHTLLELVEEKAKESANKKNLIVLTGRSRRMAVESHQTELQKLIVERNAHIGSSVPRTLGDVGAALVASGTTASLLIMQAAVSGA